MQCYNFPSFKVSRISNLVSLTKKKKVMYVMSQGIEKNGLHRIRLSTRYSERCWENSRSTMLVQGILSHSILSENGWIIVVSEGNMTGYSAFLRQLLRYNVLLRPLHWTTGEPCSKLCHHIRFRTCVTKPRCSQGYYGFGFGFWVNWQYRPPIPSNSGNFSLKPSPKKHPSQYKSSILGMSIFGKF